MATGSALGSALEKISRDHLECSICQERYTQPKILDCLHSFCEKCLVNYYNSKYKDAPNMPCPLCRQEVQLSKIGVQGLKTNFILSAMIEEFSQQENVMVLKDTILNCELCDGNGEAKHRCLECALNICSNCKKMHPRIAALSGHTVMSLEEIPPEKEVTKTPQEDESGCHKHKGEVQKLYCETCEKPICEVCTVVDHRQPEHHYIDSETALIKRKESVKDLVPVFNREIKRFDESLATASRAKEEFTQKTKAAVNKVEDIAAKMIAKVKSMQTQMVDEIKTVEKYRSRRFEEHVKSLNLMIHKAQSSLHGAHEITKTTSDSDFLSKFSQLSQELKSLSGQDAPTVDPRISYFRFVPSMVNYDVNIGKLELEGKWQLYGRLKKQGGFSGVRSIDAAQPGEIIVADINRKAVYFCSIKASMVTQDNALAMSAYPRDIKSIHNQLVIVDSTGLVKVYNKDHTLAFQFPTTPSGTRKTEVKLKSVAVKKNSNILVGDVCRNVLTEHNPADGTLIRTIPVGTSPGYLAVDRYGRIIVSSAQHEVLIIDDNGTTLITIKPTIDGQPVKYSRGVCCDASSGIYVAVHNDDSDAGHIHHYDAGGRFLGCIIQGLYYPHGITFIEGGQQLAVADWFSVKIYHMV